VIYHIVSYSFSPDVGAAEVEKVTSLFSAMSEIPSVLAVHVGMDAGPANAYSAIVTLTDVDGYDEYLRHPLHLDTLSFAKPLFALTEIRDVCPDRETAADLHALKHRH